MFVRASRKAVAGLSFGIVVLALYAANPDTPLDTEDLANTTTAGAQQSAAVARSADGDYVVVWAGNGSQTDNVDAAGVFFQRYDASGEAQGVETRVNTTTAGTQASPAVAMDAAGNFVIAWSGNGAQADQVDADGIFVQRFDAAGVPQGSETRANTTTANVQDLPAVAADADGDFIVVWQSLGQDGSGQGVYGQRFDAAGAAQGAEFGVNDYTSGSQRDASVAMDQDGNFVVVWESNGADGDLNGVRAKRYAADGTELGDGEADGVADEEFGVNTTVAGTQDNPVVSRRPTGEFIVAWSGPDAAVGTDIFARRFDSAGGPIDAAEFTVNASTVNSQSSPAIAVDADGHFVIAWDSNHSGTYDIVARSYTPALVAGSEIAVNASSPTTDQTAPAVAVDADGDVVVAWQDGTDVYARRVVGPEPIDLAISKTDSADPATAGAQFSYTLTVENLHAGATPSGTAAIDDAIGGAAGVVVVDALPAGGGDGVTFVEATGAGWTCDNTGNTSVTCALAGPLAAGATAAPITVTVLAPAIAPADRSISNSASVSSDQYDAVPGNDLATQETVVCAAGESPGTLSVTSTTAGEAAGTGAVTVTRTGDSCGSVSVQVGLAAGTATATSDFTATTPQTLTWNNGESGAKSVATPVTIVNDAVYETDETVAVTLSNALRAALGSNGTLTITDNEAAPSLAIADGSVAEGNSGTTLLPLAVTLTPASGTTIARQVTVRYDSANGTATTADGDYVAAANQTLTFTCATGVAGCGASSQNANVTVNGDVKDEADETITVTLSSASGATLGDATGTGTITDDDAVPTVAFAAATSAVSEAATNPPLNTQAPTLDVTVTLSTASSNAVTVDLAFAGTAATPADYSASTTQVSFAAGETSKNVRLTVALDALDEDHETVQLTLSNPGNAALGTQVTHVATITDDDALPTVSVSGPATIAENASPGTATLTLALSAASGREVRVSYGVAGAAALGTDYTLSPAPGEVVFNAGEASKSITVTVVNDALDEANEALDVTLSSPVNAAISDADNPDHALRIDDEDAAPTVSFTAASQDVAENVASGTATATVQLAAVSGRDVTVPFTVNPAPAVAGDAVSGDDYSVSTTSPLTIPAGSTTATLTIAVVNDGVNESDENVRLVMDTAGLVNATAGATTTHVATITNDDTLPQVSFQSSSQSSSEGAGTATVTVNLSRTAEQDVTVSYTLGGTAAAGTDYTVTPASPFVIAEGESSAVLTLTLVDDARIEDNETAVVTLSNAVNGTVLADGKTHTLTLTNNDTAGVIITPSGGSTDVVEGGSTDTYTIVLTSEPTGDVAVSPASSGQVGVSGSATFSPSGANAWNVPQTITVSAVDDFAGEGPHDDTITHSVTSGDLDYEGLAAASVPVNITDDDVPAIIIQQSAGGTTVAEGGATDSYEVFLSALPAQDVGVTLSHGAEVSLSATSLTFTAANWDQAQVVTVTAVDDAMAEGAQMATISHQSSSADAGFDGLTAEVSVQVGDNDAAGVILSKTTASVTEGGAGDSYTVQLNSQPFGDVVVTLAPSAQVSTGSTEIVFNAVNWNLAVTVAVSAVDDAVDEPSPHSGAIAHSVTAASDANYDGITVADVAVSVTDDDAPPAVTLAVADSPLDEDGGIATVTATLGAASSNEVTVDLAFSGTATLDTDYTRSGTSITIPAGLLSGSVSLTGVDDSADEADETVVVDIAAVTNGTESGTQQVTATVADDDAAPPSGGGGGSWSLLGTLLLLPAWARRRLAQR